MNCQSSVAACFSSYLKLTSVLKQELVQVKEISNTV